ncbi:MAG: hypothetical protein ACFFEY_10110 [Candidatus Thorarchaeota archaeon]
MEEKDSTIKEYERIIRELMNENENLRKRVSQLEEENRNFKASQVFIKESPNQELRNRKKEPILKSEIKVSSTIFSQDTEILDMSKVPIVEGVSRRECPTCGNSNKTLIHEIIDKARIISAYPRLYGKKYKCGQCGREWRIPLEM